MHEYHFHIAVHSIAFFLAMRACAPPIEPHSLHFYVQLVFIRFVPLLVGRERSFSLSPSVCVCVCATVPVHIFILVSMLYWRLWLCSLLLQFPGTKREKFTLSTQTSIRHAIYGITSFIQQRKHTHTFGSSTERQKDLKPNRNNTERQTEMALCVRDEMVVAKWKRKKKKYEKLAAMGNTFHLKWIQNLFSFHLIFHPET